MWYWIGMCRDCGLTIVRRGGYMVTFVCSCPLARERMLSNRKVDDGVMVVWDEFFGA